MTPKRIAIFLFFALLCTAGLYAQNPAEQLLNAIPGGAQEVGQPKLLTQLAVLAGLAILPFAIMLLTSYVKIIIVLSLLRNALGVQQTPPQPCAQRHCSLDDDLRDVPDRPRHV